MPEYLSPGVYVEEIDAGPKPIEGVSTSTAGAIGVTLRGPTDGKPQLVTSFADFVRQFGGFLTEPTAAMVTDWTQTKGGRWWHFPLAVKGFFDNGGKRVFVKRVAAATAVAASAKVGKGLVSPVVQDAAAGSTTLKLGHLIGVGTAPKKLKLFNGETGAQIGGDFDVEAYDPATGKVTVDPALAAGQALVAGRGDFAAIRAQGAAAGDETLVFEARSKGKWGDSIQVRVRPTVAATLNLLPSPNPAVSGKAVVKKVKTAAAAGATPIQVDDFDPADLADTDRVVVKGREYTLSSVNATANTFVVTPAVPAGETWEVDTEVRRLRKANAGGTKVNAWGAPKLYEGALVELDSGTGTEVRTVDARNGDELTLSGAALADYSEGHKLRLIEFDVAVRVVRDGAVEAEETFPPLRLKDDGSLSHLVNHLNERSALVRVQTGSGFSASDAAKLPNSANGTWQAFSAGDDKLDDLEAEDFIGTDGGSGKRTGIAALEDIDEISICLVPGVWAPAVQAALIGHCELLKDRFAILDPPNGLSIEGIRAFREPIDSKYAALYYPWVVVRDPLAKREVTVAPSGHIAGVYARVDVERGVHKAPANEVIRGIVRIAQDVTMREQDLLNPKGINALRFFPGRGNRVWGARTVSSDPSWKYVNVRRLFLYVEESIDEGTQWVVFEPNDEPLWARVRQTITNFLTTVWRSGALEGATAEQAFFVKCDRTTMTGDDIDNGRLICEIGIAPTKPAEFVIFRIQQKTREAQAS